MTENKADNYSAFANNKKKPGVNKILIIDDDQELCEEVAEFLLAEGYSVETAHDSAQGELRISNNAYDLIILDFKIPGLNGIEMIKRIGRSEPKPKVILISGKPFIEKLLEEKDLSNLLAGVMNKPFDIETLLEKIKSL